MESNFLKMKQQLRLRVNNSKLYSKNIFRSFPDTVLTHSNTLAPFLFVIVFCNFNKMKYLLQFLLLLRVLEKEFWKKITVIEYKIYRRTGYDDIHIVDAIR